MTEVLRKPKLLTCETYYPAGYFTSNPFIGKRQYLVWNIAFAGICKVLIAGLLIITGIPAHPFKAAAYASFFIAFGWGFSYLLIRERKLKDLHEGNGPYLAVASDSFLLDKTCLEIWSDCMIAKEGRKQWIIKENLVNIQEIGSKGGAWKLALSNGDHFYLPMDLLTNLQSDYIFNKIDLNAQLDLNRDKIKKLLETYLVLK